MHEPAEARAYACHKDARRCDWTDAWELVAPTGGKRGRTANQAAKAMARESGLPPLWRKRCRGVCLDESSPHHFERCGNEELVRASAQPDKSFRLYKSRGSRLLG